MTRRALAQRLQVLLTVVLLLLLVLTDYAAEQRGGFALQVEGVPVASPIYSYYYAKALRTATDSSDANALRAQALQLCARYIAVNSELANRGGGIAQYKKTEVMARTAGVWRALGAYYLTIGVDKPDLNLLLRGEANEEALFKALFDKGGVRAVPEEDVESYFYGNYVAYEGIRLDLTTKGTDGLEREMTVIEKNELRRTLASFVEDAAKEGVDALALAAQDPYAEALGYASPAVTVLNRTTSGMPAESFQLLRELDSEQMRLVEYGSVILVARGVNMRLAPEEFYQGYRDKCLWELGRADYETALQALTRLFRTDSNELLLRELEDRVRAASNETKGEFA